MSQEKQQQAITRTSWYADDSFASSSNLLVGGTSKVGFQVPRHRLPNLTKPNILWPPGSILNGILGKTNILLRKIGSWGAGIRADLKG